MGTLPLPVIMREEGSGSFSPALRWDLELTVTGNNDLAGKADPLLLFFRCRSGSSWLDNRLTAPLRKDNATFPAKPLTPADDLDGNFNLAQGIEQGASWWD